MYIYTLSTPNEREKKKLERDKEKIRILNECREIMSVYVLLLFYLIYGFKLYRIEPVFFFKFL